MTMPLKKYLAERLDQLENRHYCIKSYLEGLEAYGRPEWKQQYKPSDLIPIENDIEITKAAIKAVNEFLKTLKQKV